MSKKLKCILFSILIAVAGVSLTSCAQSDIIRGEIAARSANAADDTLESAEWAYCEAPTIGALKRKFNTKEKMDAYLESCPSEQ